MAGRWSAVVLAAGLVLAGCGDDDDDDAADTADAADAESSESAAGGATTTAADGGSTASSGDATATTAAPDPTLAQPALLTAADVPAGWTESPQDDDEDDMEFADFPECASLASLEEVPTESEAQIGFASTDDSGSIDHEVSVGTPEDAQLVYDTVAAPEALPCIQAVFDLVQQEVAAGGGEATPIEVVAEPIEAGDEAVSYVGATTVTTAAGASVPIELRVTFIHGGRSLSTLTTLAVGPPAFDVVALAQLTGERVAAIA